MKEKRPTPEELLSRSEVTSTADRGTLKIYLGAAPGVGKTYAMLHDALEKRKNNLDVVIGIVESHGRKDIEELIKHFEVLPRQLVKYRGTTCSEFSVDLALTRHPGLILIDEMAHSNPPGLRHAKRWQDIKEFLDRGIDVYTTLNVQHIESLKDDVAQIIHAPIQETVPDSMIEMANTIVLVDLPPEELLKRLKDGKVYFPAQAELAIEHFFRKGNLIALRELALLTTAERVSSDVLLYRQQEGIHEIWPTKDKILVCVGPRPEAQKLIRAAKRMATSLQAEWVAIYVEAPSGASRSVDKRSALQNLKLAELLGAVTHVLTGIDIVQEVMAFARAQNITQIMIQKYPSTWWRFKRFRLVDEILRHSGEIDVYIMNGVRVGKCFNKQPSPSSSKERAWKSYSLAMVILTLATFINIVFYPYLSASSLVMVYLLSVTIIARLGDLSLSIVSSFLSVAIYDFLFVQPYYGVSNSDLENFFTLLVMLMVAEIISYLTIVTRRQAESARTVQHQTTALYTLSRQLTKTRGVDKLVKFGASYISEVFNCDVIVLLPKKNQLEAYDVTGSKYILPPKEASIALWVYEMGQSAGLGTDTLAFSDALFLPLLTADSVVGVMKIKPKSQQLLSPEQAELLDSCVNQVALALEVDRLHEQSTRRELKIKTERARKTLLEAISNDLHSHLKMIQNALQPLKKVPLAEVQGIERGIDFEIERLKKFDHNIIQIIQLESPHLVLTKTKASIKTIISSAIKKSTLFLCDRKVHLHIPEKLPGLFVNRKLIVEVLCHLIDNAVKFTPSNTPVTISVLWKKSKIIVSVEDKGPGVELEERDKLFETFYQGKKIMTVRGLGLGLAICHRVILQHGGNIWVENMTSRGAAFHFSLPCSLSNT